MVVDNELPIDRGWSWVILFAVTTTQFLYVGTLKSFGIFFVEILDEFKESVSVTSLINGIQSGVYCIISLPILLCGISKFGVRKAVITGSTLIATGYGISCFAPNVDFLYFSLSLVVGSGSAFLYAPSLIILGQYFDKRRGIATGIAISGGCLGSLVLPLFYRHLLDTYGLKGALLISAGLLLNNTAMACFLRPLEFYRRTKKTLIINNPEKTSEVERKDSNGVFHANGKHSNGIGNNVNNFEIQNAILNGEKISGSHPVISKSSPLTTLSSVGKSERTRTFSETNKPLEKIQTTITSSKMSLSSLYKYISLDDVATMSIVSIRELKVDGDEHFSDFVESQKTKCCNLSFSVFRNPSYILFLFVHMFGSMAPALIHSFLPVYLKDKGLTNDEIVILVSVLGAADFVGRILSGYFTDKTWIQKYQIIMVTQGLAGIVINCNSLFTNFWTLLLFSVLVGISAGGIFAVVMPILADMVGVEKFTSGLAFLIITQGPCLAVSSPIFGFLRDQTGDYNASFCFLGSASLLASLLLFIEPIIQKYNVAAQDQTLTVSVEETESLTKAH